MRVTRNPYLIAVASALSICASGSRAAEVFELTAVADAFVSSAHSASNYGGAGGLAVSASGLSNGEFQSVLRFDASASKTAFDTAFGAGQWTLQSAELQITPTSPNNGIFNPQSAEQFDVRWLQSDGWIEGTGMPNAPSAIGIDFDTLPGFLGAADEAIGSFSFNGATSGLQSYGLSTPAGFAQDLMSGGLVSLRMLAADSTVSLVFNSRNVSDVSRRPRLILTAVPEPATAGLVLIGSMVFALVRRRRH